MENSQLLCTFAKKRHITETIDSIKETYSTVSKIFVLQNSDEENELYCTYNVFTTELKQKSFMKNTISIHRNKDTNTLYTINAVNELVMLLNDGDKDSSFKISWENYKNMIVTTNEDGLKKIPTKIFKVISI
jgi:hypothetical protein